MDRLGIVVPCYNEEEVLKISSEALRNVLDDLVSKKKISEDSFVLFVNDGSKDKTWELILEEHKAHKQIKGVNLAKNVGHQYALTAGLLTAKELCDVTVAVTAPKELRQRRLQTGHPGRRHAAERGQSADHHHG